MILDLLCLLVTLFVAVNDFFEAHALKKRNKPRKIDRAT
jgi:hypothetical protein